MVDSRLIFAVTGYIIAPFRLTVKDLKVKRKAGIIALLLLQILRGHKVWTSPESLWEKNEKA